MILIRRGPEPAALARARDANLLRLRQIATTRAPSSKEIKGYGDKAIRETLWKAQHHKCCYCERQLELTHEDVEHFRPKAEANRSPGCTEAHGYWWLAYTWENLLYSCRQCNQPPAKGCQFPLERGSIALQAEQPPPGRESPLLVDPAHEIGIAHIHFQRVRHGARLRWRPTPRNGSRKGLHTIRTCQLDRDSLLDLYDEHVTSRVMHHVNKLKAALNADSPRALYEHFQRLCRTLLDERRPFVGLSYDALVHFIPDSRLSSHGLCWPNLRNGSLCQPSGFDGGPALRGKPHS